MEIKQVIIKEVDLKKLCRLKGISVRELAKRVGADYFFFNRCANGRSRMSGEMWDRVKKFL